MNIKNYNQSHFTGVEIVKIEDRTLFIALTKYHHSGNELIVGMNVFCERNVRTDLIPAKLVSWKIGSVKMDITGYGKYSESNVIVNFDGKNQSWPFSMIYIKP